MITVASITIAVLCLAVIRLAIYAISLRSELNAIRDKAEEQADTIKDIQDAISASPFVQYPYIYSNATRKY